MKTLISFRLRKDLDSDLIGMDLNESDLAELCRNGLRLILGIQKQKTIQVIEEPIQVRTIPSKPAYFSPGIKKG